MSFQDILDQIAALTNTQFGGKKDFDSPVRVKPSPHSWPVEVHGLEVGPGCGVWMKDKDGKLHKLDVNTQHHDLTATSILQRLKLIAHVTSE